MRFRPLGWLGVAIALALSWAVLAEASMKLQKAFFAKYPEAAKTTLAKCGTCHTAKAPKLNAYGTDLKAAHAKFAAVEDMDSDKDGATNLAEIKALTLPGDDKDKPAASAADSSRSDSEAGADSTSAPQDTTAKK